MLIFPLRERALLDKEVRDSLRMHREVDTGKSNLIEML